MDKLLSEIARLYFLPDCIPPNEEVLRCIAGEISLKFPLVGQDKRVRAMQLHFSRSSDWSALSDLYQLIVEELELPAPAISVSGEKGFVLWFSLAEAVPLEMAEDFLRALSMKYLVSVPDEFRDYLPSGNRQCSASVTPALSEISGRWSAFIDPTLGSMFLDEAGLEMAPNRDRQADLLASLKSISLADFGRVVQVLAEFHTLTSAKCGMETPIKETVCSEATRFLLAIMRDDASALKHRIKAAKALLSGSRHR